MGGGDVEEEEGGSAGWGAAARFPQRCERGGGDVGVAARSEGGRGRGEGGVSGGWDAGGRGRGRECGVGRG